METLIERATGRAVLLLGVLLAAAGSGRAAADAADVAAGRAVGRVATKQLDEVSGMAASRHQPDLLWMHNDGDAKYLYAVRPSGQIVARVQVPGKTRDVEDIAIGSGPRRDVDYLYLGDIGDNDERRSEVRVLRLPEPIVPSPGGDRFAAAHLDVFRLTYPDGPHNAETLLVDPVTGDVLIVTKEKRRGRVYVARASRLTTEAPVMLERAADAECSYASGGDISQDGSLIVLRRESRGWLWRRRSGESVEQAMCRPPQEIAVRCSNQALNGEAIALVADGGRYYTISEGDRQPICLFSLAPAPTAPKAAD